MSSDPRVIQPTAIATNVTEDDDAATGQRLPVPHIRPRLSIVVDEGEILQNTLLPYNSIGSTFENRGRNFCCGGFQNLPRLPERKSPIERPCVEGFFLGVGDLIVGIGDLRAPLQRFCAEAPYPGVDAFLMIALGL